MVPYRLLDANFQRIIQDNVVMATVESADNECYSLSFGCGVQVHNGSQYSVHYYGSHPADDVSDLVHHVIAHLPTAARQQTKQPLQLRILFSPLMPRDDITQAIEREPGHETCSGNEAFAIFERDVNQKMRHNVTKAKL